MEFINEFKQNAKEYNIEKAHSILEKKEYQNQNYSLVILDRFDTRVSKIDKHKYVCPGCLQFGEFMMTVRKKLKLSPDEALFFYILDEKGKANIIPRAIETMATLYKQYSINGYMFVTYTIESTFGHHHMDTIKFL